MHVHADDLEAGRVAAGPQDLRGIVERHAELAGLQAGADVRMALRVDVRVHAKRHPDAAPWERGQRVDPIEFARRIRR